MSDEGPRRWWRRRRTVWAVAVTLLVAAAAIVFGAGWYFSDRLLDPIHPRTVENLKVYAVTGGRITLPSTSKSRTQQIWGVAWPGGYGQVFGPVAVSGEQVTRGFRTIEGTLRPGTKVGLDVDAYPSDPYRHSDFLTARFSSGRRGARSPPGRLPEGGARG